jgi:thiamine kinase-like enzyme
MMMQAFLLHHNEDIDEFNNIFIQILFALHVAQKNFNFLHGDLHAGNIMLKRERVSIQINGQTIQTDYRPYFIDFGMACVDLSTCCGLNNMCVDNRIYDKQDSMYCLNKSHDIRELIFSLIDDRYSDSNPDLFLYSTFDNYFNPYRKKNVRLYYQEVLDQDDPNFYPENIITQLLR